MTIKNDGTATRIDFEAKDVYPNGINGTFSGTLSGTLEQMGEQICRIFIPTIKSPESVPVETKSLLYSDKGMIRLATYSDGRRVEDEELMADISDFKIINNSVIITTFTDGSVERATLNSCDTFDLEQGIAVCMFKKLFSSISDGNGSSIYNKFVEYGIKSFKSISMLEFKAETDKQRKIAEAKSKAEKARRKREKREAKKREAEIEIQKEAYLRAMREFNDTSATIPAK